MSFVINLVSPKTCSIVPSFYVMAVDYATLFFSLSLLPIYPHKIGGPVSIKLSWPSSPSGKLNFLTLLYCVSLSYLYLGALTECAIIDGYNER